jgi:hypothetical protein
MIALTSNGRPVGSRTRATRRRISSAARPLYWSARIGSKGLLAAVRADLRPRFGEESRRSIQVHGTAEGLPPVEICVPLPASGADRINRVIAEGDP